MKPAELKKRWSSGQGADFLKQLLRDVAHGCEIKSSPFGLHDGRVDLRGLVIPAKTSMRRVKMHNVDLGAATLSGTWIEACSFENVAFDDVAAIKVADHGNRFIECAFVGTNLKEAALGYRGSQFVRSTFVEADFRRAVFIRPEMDDVTFVDCRFEGVDLNATSFRRCTFRGEVKEAWFRGGFALPSDKDQFGAPRPNKMEDVSFENARLFGVTFSDGCELATVALPSDGSCFRFDRWKVRLEKLLEFATTRPAAERKEIEIFCRAHLVHAPWQDTYILSMEDLSSDYGDEVARVIVDSLAAT